MHKLEELYEMERNLECKLELTREQIRELINHYNLNKKDEKNV